MLLRLPSVLAVGVCRASLCASPPPVVSQIRRMSRQLLAKRLEGTGKNVWVTFTELARLNSAVNLGQGFPDYLPPHHVTEALTAVAGSTNPLMQQYTRGFGHPRMVNAMANTFGPLFGRQLDPLKNFLVTCGAYESLFCIFQGFVNPGDEVIIIEPFFDCYAPMTTVAGGTPVFVPLRPKATTGRATTSADWTLDYDELASKFSERTKMIVVNTPNNPLGKVYTRDELQQIAQLCIKHDVICISDEVYEWIVYPGCEHIRIATLPGMWERTLTVGSAGKTFSVTGWKIGWTIGPEHLMKGPMTVHQNCVYTCSTPLQEVVAIGFEKDGPRIGSPDCSFHALPASLLPKRDRMAAMLSACGMTPVLPEGGYFMLADWSKLGINVDGIAADLDESPDFKFVRWLTTEKKLATIPVSAFYSKEHQHLAENYIRFCFIKKDSTLDAAEKILTEWKQSTATTSHF